MRLSDLFTRTARESAQGEVSHNARLLIRAGYINQLMAGVYNFLPLGLRVLDRIETIIREEMDGIGAQEILMPALQPKEIWDLTGRWEKVDVLFKLTGAGDRELALGPTHEEVVTPLVTGFIRSYRDLPVAVYQVQTKFRNEPRPKAGLLRAREFRMKDMYSFHTDEASLDEFYEKAIGAYRSIFRRCGLASLTVLTFASGGIFSTYSHEFQTLTPFGEDVIYRLPGSDTAINRELIDDEKALAELLPGYNPDDKAKLEELRAIEVANIFKTRWDAPIFHLGRAVCFERQLHKLIIVSSRCVYRRCTYRESFWSRDILSLSMILEMRCR
jgi:prolyl-tRNA synthetase